MADDSEKSGHLDADEFRHLVADNELTHGAIARVMRERAPAAERPSITSSN